MFISGMGVKKVQQSKIFMTYCIIFIQVNSWILHYSKGYFKNSYLNILFNISVILIKFSYYMFNYKDIYVFKKFGNSIDKYKISNLFLQFIYHIKMHLYPKMNNIKIYSL